MKNKSYKSLGAAGQLMIVILVLLSLLIAEKGSQVGADTAVTHTIYLPLISSPAYYVATNGSDTTGYGSSARPWQTINHAVTAVPDGATILVRPGTYTGLVNLRRQFNTGITIRSTEPYQARLRNDGQVVVCFYCRQITLEGFDIAHNGPGAERYVIQIQDVRNDGIGGHYITLRNNVLHDSYNNDILKINSGASHILITGNVFYNQSGLDNHIDLTSVANITVQDNIFFNDFAGSGRANNNDTGNFVVIKDVNGTEDNILGSNNIHIRRNIFLNWEGNIGNAYIALGDTSATTYYHAYNVLIENNLMLGNAANVIHTPLKIISANDIIFRNNTVSGDLPAKSFAFRLDTNGVHNRSIQFYNNIWSDSTGTMGSEGPGDPNNFAESVGTDSFVLMNNLYWNGGQSVPAGAGDPISYTNDPQRLLVNPYLPTNQNTVSLPRWDVGNGRFADGSATISEAFTKLVQQYGTLPANSPAINAAHPQFTPPDDILGNLRTVPDIGAYEH